MTEHPKLVVAGLSSYLWAHYMIGYFKIDPTVMRSWSQSVHFLFCRDVCVAEKDSKQHVDKINIAGTIDRQSLDSQLHSIVTVVATVNRSIRCSVVR